MSRSKPEELVSKVMNAREIQSFVGADGAIVRELASPSNSPLTHHSLAEIRHSPGTASVEHYHIEAEEVYYVLEGHGAIRIDGHPRDIGPGDVISIPGDETSPNAIPATAGDAARHPRAPRALL